MKNSSLSVISHSFRDFIPYVDLHDAMPSDCRGGLLSSGFTVIYPENSKNNVLIVSMKNGWRGIQ